MVLLYYCHQQHGFYQMILNGVSTAPTIGMRPVTQSASSLYRPAQPAEGLAFGGSNERIQNKNLSFQEKKTLAFKALQKELQDPKSRYYLISGYITTALTPALLLGSVLFPVAAPALWPMAALAGFWSGVILWESFQVLKSPFNAPKK